MAGKTPETRLEFVLDQRTSDRPSTQFCHGFTSIEAAALWLCHLCGPNDPTAAFLIDDKCACAIFQDGHVSVRVFGSGTTLKQLCLVFHGIMIKYASSAWRACPPPMSQAGYLAALQRAGLGSLRYSWEDIIKTKTISLEASEAWVSWWYCRPLCRGSNQIKDVKLFVELLELHSNGNICLEKWRAQAYAWGGYGYNLCAYHGLRCDHQSECFPSPRETNINGNEKKLVDTLILTSLLTPSLVTSSFASRSPRTSSPGRKSPISPTIRKAARASSSHRSRSPPITRPSAGQTFPERVGAVFPVTFPPCKVCGAEKSQLCSGCRCISYCSARCQRDDWKEHETACYANRPRFLSQFSMAHTGFGNLRHFLWAKGLYDLFLYHEVQNGPPEKQVFPRCICAAYFHEKKVVRNGKIIVHQVNFYATHIVEISESDIVLHGFLCHGIDPTHGNGRLHETKGEWVDVNLSRMHSVNSGNGGFRRSTQTDISSDQHLWIDCFGRRFAPEDVL